MTTHVCIPAVIGIDPGPHIGLCVYYPDTGVFKFQTLDYTGARDLDGPEDGTHLSFHRWLEENVHPNDTVICERFEFRKDERDRTKIDYTAVEYIGVLKLHYQRWNQFVLAWQSASQAKQFWTNDKLKEVYLYKPGEAHKHEMDALRHVLYYLTFAAKNEKFLHHLKR